MPLPQRYDSLPAAPPAGEAMGGVSGEVSLPPPPVNQAAPVNAPPPQAPAPSASSAPQQAAPQLSDDLAADDSDLIEKEWVVRAKAIVDKTKNDPHLQNKQINQMKADYIKKRYNKDLKLSEG